VKKTLTKEAVTADDVKKVLESLAVRNAEKKSVERGAKKDDEVVISFKGTDTKGEPIKGADGKDYPLVLGSDTFIPGFEDNIIGLKSGDKKEFTLTFPKDYGVKALANKKVTFAVTVAQVNELTPAKIDDNFASKVGPFKTVAELKTDIKKQLELERSNQAERQLENEIIQEIVDKSSVELPESLIEEQIERLKTEVRQNLTYRGQTWQEMLEAEGTTDEQYTKDFLRPEAERRVKTGLILAEISIEEKLDISPEELEVRMQVLKSQYQDAAMQSELEKPEARRDIASRMLTEKTVQRLVELATKK
jgi:trigger factor